MFVIVAIVRVVFMERESANIAAFLLDSLLLVEGRLSFRTDCLSSFSGLVHSSYDVCERCCWR